MDERNIKRGGCNIKRIKWDIEKAKAYFEEHGLDVLDDEFVNTKTPITFRDKDGYISSKNICIEVDGEQHNKEHSIYYSDKTVRHDGIKDEYCVENGIQLIRIPFSAYSKHNEYRHILSSNIL